jgi:5,5'-dehydrodivanillate O-demethylase oxygenase subunit
MDAKQNERLSRVGPGTPCGELMRRYWHPIAAASQLPEHGTMPIRILGEDMVLYRDRRGGLGLIEPHCAHRGAGLLFGIPDDHGLRCSYHGWLYDETGQCTETPFETFVDPSSSYKDRIRLKAYPLEELGGLIWAYLGPEPRPLLPRWEGFVRPEVKREIGMALIPCNWLQSIENSGDAPHVVYAHRHFSSYVLEKLGRPDLQRHEWSSGMLGLQPKRTPVRSPYGWGSVMFPYTGALRDLYELRVPVDDTHTLYIVYNMYTAEQEEELGVEIPPQDDPRAIPFFDIPVPGVDAKGQPQWSLLDGNSGQDILMWTSQGATGDRTREHLGHGDEQVIRLRQLLEEQIGIVEEGGDPINTFRDPAENECLMPRWTSKNPLLRPDGGVDRTDAARKYSVVFTEAAAKRHGEDSLKEPVH